MSKKRDAKAKNSMQNCKSQADCSTQSNTSDECCSKSKGMKDCK
ncbi:MAG: hypothetical protein R3Y09_02485 [Clostridia bacterium]